jgi:DNA-directed RNA polymerase subunit M/transcription elongation factor TFIIS
MSAESRAVPETFAFACGDCGHTWEATFQLMFFTDPLDPSGVTTQEYVDEAGKAIRSPLADAVCPECGGRKVRVLEAGLAERARRAEHEPRPHHDHHFHLPHGHHRRETP